MNTTKERKFKPEKLFEPRDFKRPEIQDKQYLEIGAGKGMHAMQFAEANPSKHLIAIERTRAKFDVFSERSRELALNNLLPVHADAIPWVVHALPPESLEGVFLLYPNPEPKNSSQRWLNMPFFEFLISRMKPNATLVLVTNIVDYFKETTEVNRDVWKLKAEESEVPKDSARTHFEIKYLARGENCYQLLLTKPHNYKTSFDEWAI
ncbi:SAM-dependent methyltransferase [Kangiella japonica]|uniref:tRNA (guanine(46)-N(7))-methyltransferase n=1 Tax=Kangiella japonica TaxID=647384 RepID=A0ABP3CIM9_9GAMM